ncbi:MAG: hypothetical protein ABSE48_07710 [Verrucomicrobiota bacterium]|jgi:hypothetical protein
MEFIKRNYEKILLGLVLAGLIGVLVFMFFYIASDTQAMKDRSEQVTHPKARQLDDLDMSAETNAIARLQAPYALDLDKTNKLFNTMEWQKAADGTLIKISSGNEVGPNAAVVVNIQPLYLILTFDSVMTNEFGARYQVYVAQQADKNPFKRRKQQHFVSVGDKIETFQLTGVNGDPMDPDALVVKLADTGQMETIPRGKSFQRVDAYSADFRYDPEKKVFNGKRVGDKISFGGGDYVVVEINQNELILSDQSNQRKYPLPFTP